MAKGRKSKSRSLTTRTKRSPGPAAAGRLLDDVRRLIDEARGQVAQTVNAGLVALNWHVGHRIRQDILGERRAEYGQQIVATLSRQLGWSHFKKIIPLEDRLKREFYAEMCRLERRAKAKSSKRRSSPKRR